MQLTTGEGPCLDAISGSAPVLVGDLAADPGRWIGFGPEAVTAGAAAVFSLPLHAGAARLGTLDLHRDTAGALSRDQLADGLLLAGLAGEILLELGDPGPTPGGVHDVSGAGAGCPGWLPGVHTQVHQASGMVSEREGIGVDEALLRIRGHAYAHGEPIDQVARRILDRCLSLDGPDAAGPDVIAVDGRDDDPDGSPPDAAGR